MLNFLSILVSSLWAIFKYPIYLALIAIVLFLVLLLIQFSFLYTMGYRFKKGEHYRIKNKHALKRLFIDAPRQIMIDLFHRDPEAFRFKGLHMFCGEQGSGKTIALVEFMMRIQKEYPKAKTITNLAYKFEDDELVQWQQLLTYSNSDKGVIVGIDELQNWFSSARNSLPTEMLEVITQNRKNRRIVLATSQVFTRVSKGLREQATLLYLPITLLGCITWVRIKKPILDNEGNVLEYKSRGSYFFVHSKEIREAYDTYKVIHSLSKEGFKDVLPEINVINKATVVAKK